MEHSQDLLILSVHRREGWLDEEGWGEGRGGMRIHADHAATFWRWAILSPSERAIPWVLQRMRMKPWSRPSGLRSIETFASASSPKMERA